MYHRSTFRVLLIYLPSWLRYWIERDAGGAGAGAGSAADPGTFRAIIRPIFQITSYRRNGFRVLAERTERHLCRVRALLRTRRPRRAFLHRRHPANAQLATHVQACLPLAGRRPAGWEPTFHVRPNLQVGMPGHWSPGLTSRCRTVLAADRAGQGGSGRLWPAACRRPRIRYRRRCQNRVGCRSTHMPGVGTRPSLSTKASALKPAHCEGLLQAWSRLPACQLYWRAPVVAFTSWSLCLARVSSTTP